MPKTPSQRGRSSRAKGQRGERDAIKLLGETVQRVYNGLRVTPPDLQRNQLQSDKGGSDLAGLPYFAIEVKNAEALLLDAWWYQCMGQATARQTPVLLYKRNHRSWRARYMAPVAPQANAWRPAVVDVDSDTFLVWFAAMLTMMVEHDIRTGALTQHVDIAKQ